MFGNKFLMLHRGHDDAGRDEVEIFSEEVDVWRFILGKALHLVVPEDECFFGAVLYPGA